MNEEALTFECNGEHLIAILHAGAPAAQRGVVIVVGGPQYRVGSHRQFVQLARELAAAGLPVLRFDYRGMGDAEGNHPGFEHIAPDIAAAIDLLQARVPGVRETVLWGLCDAASAAMLYAHDDARVTGLVLANPWVRTESSEAQAYLRHYYGERLRSRDFWRKVFGGGLHPIASLRSLLAHLRSATARGMHATEANAPFPVRMLDGLERFRGRVLVLLSGNDLTAAEFRDQAAASPRWQRVLGTDRVTRRELPGATHTFSSAAWRRQAARWTAEWLASW